MSPQARELVAAAVASEAVRGGGFVLARLVAEQVRKRPVDTSFPGWEFQLESVVGDWFNQLLDGAGRPERTDTEGAGIGRYLLSALGWGEGNGLPARHVWPAVAEAIAEVNGEELEIRGTDVAWALSTFGHYIIESGEAGQAVYRLFHPWLAAHIRRSVPDEAAVERGIAERQYELFAAQTGDGRVLERASPYLRLHLLDHLARADDWDRIFAIALQHPDDFGSSALDALDKRAFALEDNPGAAAQVVRRALELQVRLEEVASVPLPPKFVADRLTRLAVLEQQAEHDAAASDAAAAAFASYATLIDADPRSIRDLVNAAVIGSAALDGLDLHDEAIAMANEAWQVAGALSNDDPEVVSTKVSALNSLANRLAGAHEFEAALRATVSAVQLADVGEALQGESSTFESIVTRYSLASRLVSLERYAEALMILDDIIEVAAQHRVTPSERRMFLKMLKQRVALLRELGDESNIVQTVTWAADVWIDGWLATPTIAGRLGLLTKETDGMLSLIATMTRRRILHAHPQSAVVDQLEGLAGILELWKADARRASRLLMRPKELAEEHSASRRRGDQEQSRTYAQALLATGLALPATREEVRVAREVEETTEHAVTSSDANDSSIYTAGDQP